MAIWLSYGISRLFAMAAHKVIKMFLQNYVILVTVQAVNAFFLLWSPCPDSELTVSQTFVMDSVLKF